MLFDLGGFGADELALLCFLCNLAQTNGFRGDFQSRLFQFCHMELLDSNYRDFPGCLPDLGIISALQDFLQRVYSEETDTSGKAEVV